jgi:hypothetical protein
VHRELGPIPHLGGALARDTELAANLGEGGAALAHRDDEAISLRECRPGCPGFDASVRRLIGDM